jgi:hypothetical protein
MVIDSIRSALVPVHREGYKFIAIFAGVTAFVFFLTGIAALGWWA